MALKLFVYRKVNGKFVTEERVLDMDILAAHREASKLINGEGNSTGDETVIMCWVTNEDPADPKFMGFGPVWGRATDTVNMK